MEKNVNRRQILTLLGAAAGVGSAATLLGHAEVHAAAPATSPLAKTPWPYRALDPDKVAQRAYESYLKGHCMYGTFEAIVGTLAEQLGAPYTDFPFDMFHYGAAGINGWATVCGSLNGSAAAISLLSPNPSPLIDALFTWYEAEPLPNFYAKGMKFPEVRSVAKSPLCHESIAMWTKASGKKSYSPERAERCGGVTAAAAHKTVMLLNEQLAGKNVVFTLPSQTKGCMSCHEKGGMVENIRTKMDCGECHTAEVKNHHGQS